MSDDLRVDASAILRAAVDAVDPFPLTTAAIAAGLPFSKSSSRVRLIAVGKAAWPMTQAACAALAGRVMGGVAAGHRGDTAGHRGNTEGHRGDTEGHGGNTGGHRGDTEETQHRRHTEETQRIEWIDGAHPLPDERSVRAATRAMALAREAAAAGEPVLLLLSGGASAMLAAPAPGLSLSDKQRATASLLRAGADIAQLNCVRKHLSAVKGGRLGAMAGECITLAISDVHAPPDDPAVIASGPAAADPTTFEDALRVIDALGCVVPDAVRTHLRLGAAGKVPETPKPGDPRLARCSYRVIGNRRTAMEGAAREARRRGYAVQVVDAASRGEARFAGRLFAERALAALPVVGRLCVIASGEPTVTVRGEGRGGRNQEFALGAAAPLAAARELTLVASLGTDGVDGPTDAAGAVVSSRTIAQAMELGFDVDDVLARNDAYPLLDRLEQLIKWGPTRTNVGDLHILLTMRR